MGLFGGDGRHMLTIQASKIQGHGKYIWYLTYIVYCWRQKIARNRSFPLILGPVWDHKSSQTGPRFFIAVEALSALATQSIQTQLLALPVHALTQS